MTRISCKALQSVAELHLGLRWDAASMTRSWSGVAACVINRQGVGGLNLSSIRIQARARARENPVTALLCLAAGGMAHTEG